MGTLRGGVRDINTSSTGGVGRYCNNRALATKIREKGKGRRKENGRRGKKGMMVR
jgi:hypothetical protein